MDTVVEFKGVSKKYSNLSVLEGINLSVNQDDFMVIYGMPSSGKTVLLRLLMGLESPDIGDIILRGKNVSQMPPKVRNIGYVPQDFALIPHKTIFENIAYPLRLMKKSALEIKPVVQHAAAMLSIEDLLDKLPTQLSGGQKQRVAVARGIVKETNIYLFDDPLAGLDFKLRERLIDDLRQLQEDIGACFIYATSDPIESLTLAARIAVLHQKTISEIGDPRSLYLNPHHLSTIDTLGFPRANLLDGKLIEHSSEMWCRTDVFEFPVSLDAEFSTTKDSTAVTVAVRPEKIQKASDNSANCLSADIYLREDLGAEEIVYLNVQDCSLTMVNPSSQNGYYDVGDQISICIDAASLFVFEKDTGNRIGRGVDHINA
jgi:multiple sugar transport system ATP-binding protein